MSSELVFSSKRITVWIQFSHMHSLDWHGPSAECCWFWFSWGPLDFQIRRSA